MKLPQIIGDKKRGITPIIPVSKSTWWAGVKNGRFPKPVRIGVRSVAWRSSDIKSLVNDFKVVN